MADSNNFLVRDVHTSNLCSMSIQHKLFYLNQLACSCLMHNTKKCRRILKHILYFKTLRQLHSTDDFKSCQPVHKFCRMQRAMYATKITPCRSAFTRSKQQLLKFDNTGIHIHFLSKSLTRQVSLMIHLPRQNLGCPHVTCQGLVSVLTKSSPSQTHCSGQ